MNSNIIPMYFMNWMLIFSDIRLVSRPDVGRPVWPDTGYPAFLIYCCFGEK